MYTQSCLWCLICYMSILNFRLLLLRNLFRMLIFVAGDLGFFVRHMFN